MRFVHAYFSGNLIMDGALPGTYGHAFGNTLDYGGSKDSGTSFLRDTLSWPIYAVFNHRHTVCTYLKADVYVYGTIDFHAYVDEWYFGSDIVFIDLPLVRVTSNAIEYGARGSSVKGLAKQITEWGSYDGHVHGSKSCTGVIWDDPTTIPEITLTFSR